MTMHEVSVDVYGIEISAMPHGTEGRTQRLWTGKIARVQFEANDLEIAFFKTLVAKATHFHRHHFRQFARKITYMHSRTAVDVGRILVCEKKDLQAKRRIRCRMSNVQ